MSRDPDRSRPPKFWSFPIDIDTSVCDRCSAMVPATETAQKIHAGYHRDIDWLTARTGTIPNPARLSDPGLRPAGSTGVPAEFSPGSDPSVPTPPQDDTTGRGGVEDAKHSHLDAGLPPGVAQAPDAPTSPGGSSGAAKGTGRGSGGSGENHGSAPAGTTARLHLVDTEPPDYWGRFGR